MTHTWNYSAHLGYLFTELPFPARFAAAKRHGFSAVEHPAPYDVPATDLAGWLREVDLPYVQFGLRSGDATRGEKGLAIFPDRRAAFRESVAIGLDYAEAIGVRLIHAMAGVLPAADRTGAHRDCYLDNLAYAADAAAARGVTILVEAMSRHAVPDYFVETPGEAAELIEAVGRPNVRLLFDVFHAVSSGLDPVAEIAARRDLIGHVHIADYPGRHEPGTGGLDFAALRDALAQAGYGGFLGCEYNPRGDTEAGLGWLPRPRAG